VIWVRERFRALDLFAANLAVDAIFA
jgi:hypothetical protein